MITFFIALAALLIGFATYAKFVERLLQPVVCQQGSDALIVCLDLIGVVHCRMQ